VAAWVATVDMAMVELRGHDGSTALKTVKQIIHDHTEWNAKLEREIFSDANIERAIQTSRELFV
jgi:type I restriction enzyme S subunit